MSSWFIYLLGCGDGSIYTGCATNVERRVHQHREGKGARYTRSRGPLTLLFSHPTRCRSHALKVEARIKRLTHAQKQDLVAQPLLWKNLLEDT